MANYIDLNPNTNHVWYASGNTVTLDFNLATGNGGATGIDDQAVRQAVSVGIDRGVLSSIGESGYEAAATSAGGLNPRSRRPTRARPTPTTCRPTPRPPRAALRRLDRRDRPERPRGDGWTQPAGWGTSTEANCDGTVRGQLLEQGRPDHQVLDLGPRSLLGLLGGRSGDLEPASGRGHGRDHGQRVRRLLPVAGRHERRQVPDRPPLGPGGNIPFVQLDNWLDYSVNCTARPVTAPAATTLSSKSSAAQTALQQYEGADPTTSAGQATIATAIQTLEGIMATHVPFAPVLYGADWNVYSTLHYTGWPSASNPYMDPSPDDPELPYILMQLKPVAS